MAFIDKQGLTHLWNRLSVRLDNKVTKVTGKDLSTNDYTYEDKNKLAGIEAGANKIVVDNRITETSRNPVESRKIYEKFEDIQTQIDEKADKNEIPVVEEITNDEIDAIWDNSGSYRLIKTEESAEFNMQDCEFLSGDYVEISATEWNDSGYIITIETSYGEPVEFEYIGEHNGASFTMPSSDVFVTFTKI